MKKQILVLFLFLLFYQARSQQNFFNVPSSEITAPKKMFFQQQVNLFTNGLQSNTTFSYGLGHNYEIGLNLLDITYINHHLLFQDHHKPFTPLATLNFQKKFQLSDAFGFSMGTQIGSNRIGKAGMYVFSNGVYHHKNTSTRKSAGWSLLFH